MLVLLPVVAGVALLGAVGAGASWLDTNEALSLALVWTGMAVLGAAFFFVLYRAIPAAIKATRALL